MFYPVNVPALVRRGTAGAFAGDSVASDSPSSLRRVEAPWKRAGNDQVRNPSPGRVEFGDGKRRGACDSPTW